MKIVIFLTKINYHTENLFMTFFKYIYILLLFMLISVTIVFSQSKTEIDSMYAETLKLADDTNKVNSLNELSWFCVNNSYLSEANKIGEKSYEISKKLNYIKGIAYATKSIAATYFYGGNYDKALIFYEKSHKAFNDIGHKKGIAIAFRNLGNVYHQLGNYKTAIEYYFKSLKLREEINDKRGIAAVYGAIGLVYMEQGKKERKSALEYFNKALAIDIELNNKNGMAMNYLYIGNVYSERFIEKKLSDIADSALIYFNKCKEISEEIENVYLLAIVEEALGLNYLQRKEYNKAYEYYENSLRLNIEMGNKFGMAGVYNSLGVLFKNQKNIKKAKQYFLKSYNTAHEIQATNIEKESSGELSYIYSKLGEFKSAFEYQLISITLKDSLQNKENTKKLTQLAMQYEFDKKEKLQELETQKREVIFQADIKRQKMTTNFFIALFSIVFVFAFFVYRSFRNKKKANKLLQEKNTEINQQREEIEQQRDYAVEQTEIISEQHKHITDSIVYAQRIQNAVLPPKEYLDSLLKEYFILYKPRDIVSGDYYWATEKDNKIILAVADCTGHGVPGAFMSLLGTSFLNEIVNKFDTSAGQEIKASNILDSLRIAVKTSLRQTGKDTEAKDGMDMSLVIIDFEKNIMQYSGANNPIIIIRNNELVKHKADRMPVGIHYKGEKDFTNNIIDIQKGDAIYMFSDGYIDQFGGAAGRKYMIKRFSNLILQLWQSPMPEQEELFDDVIVKWQRHENDKGEEFKQIDDILVVGFRV